MILRKLGLKILGRSLVADEFNQRIVAFGGRLMSGAAPFGRLVSDALRTGERQPGAMQEHVRLREAVHAVSRDLAGLTTPSLPGAQDLRAAFESFVAHEMAIAANDWRELADLVAGTGRLDLGAAERALRVVSSLGEEEVGFLAEVRRLQDRFLQLNTRSAAN